MLHRWIVIQLNLVGPLYQVGRTVTSEVRCELCLRQDSED